MSRCYHHLLDLLNLRQNIQFSSMGVFAGAGNERQPLQAKSFSFHVVFGENFAKTTSWGHSSGFAASRDWEILDLPLLSNMIVKKLSCPSNHIGKQLAINMLKTFNQPISSNGLRVNTVVQLDLCCKVNSESSCCGFKIPIPTTTSREQNKTVGTGQFFDTSDQSFGLHWNGDWSRLAMSTILQFTP